MLSVFDAERNAVGEDVGTNDLIHHQWELADAIADYSSDFHSSGGGGLLSESFQGRGFAGVRRVIRDPGFFQASGKFDATEPTSQSRIPRLTPCEALRKDSEILLLRRSKVGRCAQFQKSQRSTIQPFGSTHSNRGTSREYAALVRPGRIGSRIFAVTTERESSPSFEQIKLVDLLDQFVELFRFLLTQLSIGVASQQII